MAVLLPRLAAGLLVFLAFRAAAGVLRRLVERAGARAGLGRRPRAALAARGVWFAVVALGALRALETVGVDLTALVAGLGLLGFALGFALRDAVSSPVAGVPVLLYRPFVPGDRIEVAGNTGTVRAIDLRYTVLERDDGDRVLLADRPVLSNALQVARRSGSADSRDRPSSARSRDRWSRSGRPRAAPPAAGGPPRVIRPLPIP